MQFELEKAVSILKRTPGVIKAMLHDLDEEWLNSNEGADTWTPVEIIGHLVHGEKTDWIPRTHHILAGNKQAFEPFDMNGHLKELEGKSFNQLLEEFKSLRQNNILALKEAGITEKTLALTGTHPTLGTVTLRQLLASWVVHDLTHIHQLSRVLAKQYDEAVGPWKAFMGVLGGKR